MGTSNLDALELLSSPPVELAASLPGSKSVILT